MNGDPIIVLPTRSSYKDIVYNFLQLLRKNWPGCPYDIIVSVSGDKISIDGIKVEYNGKNASLVECIANVAKRYKKENYIIFLGDAFIDRQLNEDLIAELIETLVDNKTDYCSLNYIRNCKKEKKFNHLLRYINELDRYSHNFVAFFASREYVEKTLSKFETDLDFEKYYLYRSKNKYYRRHLAVRKNYFNIVPGITKGKWDRINHRKLQRHNPDIYFATRPVQTRKETVICHVRDVVVSFLPDRMRVMVKRFVTRSFKFEFGVDD